MNLKKFLQPPCLRDDCMIQPFICTSFWQEGWFGQCSCSFWIWGAVWDVLEQGMPRGGGHPCCCGSLALSACGSTSGESTQCLFRCETTLGYAESVETGTFPITQKILSLTLCVYRNSLSQLLRRNQEEKHALAAMTISPQGPAKPRSNGFGKRDVWWGENKQQNWAHLSLRLVCAALITQRALHSIFRF